MTLASGTPQQFAAVREFLAAAQYTEAGIRERMGVRRLSEARKMRFRTAPEDEVDLLIQAFLLGESIARPLPCVFEELGLMAADKGEHRAAVSLYPVGGVYVVSDWENAPEPMVFSAITPLTEEFLSLLPEDPCPAYLEMCAGAGAAALIAASKFAAHAFAYDLSDRSCAFAEFSKALNGLRNVTVGQGDLYAPAGRQKFDRIVAHPPYVPSLRPSLMFRDGGEDGEWLTRGLVEGLPNYLQPGGRFYCLAMVAGVQDDPFENRVRRWLRESESEFDVFVGIRKTLDPARLIFENLSARTVQPGDIQRWQSVLKQRRIEAFHYVSLILRRRTDGARPFTIRRHCAPDCPVSAVESLLSWELGGKETDRRYVSRAVEMTAARSLEDGRWTEGAIRYSVSAPFQSSFEGPAWIADVLARCDGRSALAELRPQEVGQAEFERTVRELISLGFLTDEQTSV